MVCNHFESTERSTIHFHEIHKHQITNDLRFPHSLSEFRTTSCKGGHIFGISVILCQGKGSHAKTRRREGFGVGNGCGRRGYSLGRESRDFAVNGPSSGLSLPCGSRPERQDGM
jgi:hypothetical protein